MSVQKNILHDLANSTLSLSEIAKKYGRSVQTVRKMMFDNRIERPAVRRGHKDLASQKALSPYHTALGIRITLARDTQGYTEFADQIGVSRYTLRMMELGLHDFTLSQLLKLSTFLGQNVTQLIETQNGR